MSCGKKMSIVVALAEETLGIGYQGKLPWHIPGEMKYFKELTLKTKASNSRNAVVMGRKTWESIPKKFRPLNGRVNIIVSSRAPEEVIEPKDENTFVVKSLEESFRVVDSLDTCTEKFFLIGGSSLFHQALLKDVVDELYITEVKGEYKVDVFFPLINLENGRNSSFKEVTNDFENVPDVPNCAFKKYVREEEEKKPLKISEEKENIEGSLNSSSESVDKVAKKVVDSATELDNIRKEIKQNSSKHEEYQYLDLVGEAIAVGNVKMDRTQVGTHSLFGRTMRFSLENDVFPLLTTKSTFFRGVAEELLFFISGKTDNRILQEKRIHIWDLNCTREFLDKRGLKDREVNDLGPVYGFQWRHFGADYKTFKDDYSGKGVDQLKTLIERIKTNPNCRRLILSAWNVKDLPQMVLPPCHMFAQFYVHDGKLSCQMYQRSADLGLGVPFNIASYALLTRMIAQCCGLKAHEFVHVMGDCHVYKNHVTQLKQQLKRKPREFPKLKLNKDKTDIDSFVFEDFELVGYKPHKKIKMQMAV